MLFINSQEIEKQFEITTTFTSKALTSCEAVRTKTVPGGDSWDYCFHYCYFVCSFSSSFKSILCAVVCNHQLRAVCEKMRRIFLLLVVLMLHLYFQDPLVLFNVSVFKNKHCCTDCVCVCVCVSPIHCAVFVFCARKKESPARSIHCVLRQLARYDSLRRQTFINTALKLTDAKTEQDHFAEVSIEEIDFLQTQPQRRKSCACLFYVGKAGR